MAGLRGGRPGGSGAKMGGPARSVRRERITGRPTPLPRLGPKVLPKVLMQSLPVCYGPGPDIAAGKRGPEDTQAVTVTVQVSGCHGACHKVGGKDYESSGPQLGRPKTIWPNIYLTTIRM